MILTGAEIAASKLRGEAKYGGMDAALMTRMKELEAENARFKKCMPWSGKRLTF